MSSMNAANENEMLGASWPTKSETQEWALQFQTAGPSTSSTPAAAATVKQEQEEDNGDEDEDEESLTEIEISVSGEEEEEDGQESNENDDAPKGIYYMMSRNKNDDGDDFGDSGEEDGQDANEIDGPSSEKVPNVDRLIHTREMLQNVLCPFEKVQQFAKLCAIDEKEKKLWVLRKSRRSLACLAAFRVQQKSGNDSLENNSPTELRIDEINKVEKGTITFKHYGQLKMDSLHPHYGPIGDEDFEKWVEIHCNAINSNSKSEELPREDRKMTRKNVFLEQLELTITSSILRRHLLTNPCKIFDGILGQPPIMPAYVDISPIIIETDHFQNLCKYFRATDFSNVKILSGLCILVNISEIKNHSMVLPPLMTLIKYMFIPISKAIFAPKHTQMKASMIKLGTINGNGRVICSAQFRMKKLKLPNEQLKVIQQISLAIWTMNNIPLPTPEHVRHKATHFWDTLALERNIQIPVKVKQTANVILPPQHFIGLPLQNQDQASSSNANDNNVQKGKRKRPGKQQRMMQKPPQHFIGLPLQNQDQASSSNANNNNVQKRKRMRPAKHKRMKKQMQKNNPKVKREAQNYAPYM